MRHGIGKEYRYIFGIIKLLINTVFACYVGFLFVNKKKQTFLKFDAIAMDVAFRDFWLRHVLRGNI